jgi:spore germination protein YaaH
MIQLRVEEPAPPPPPRRPSWPFVLAAAAIGAASWLLWEELRGPARDEPPAASSETQPSPVEHPEAALHPAAARIEDVGAPAGAPAPGSQDAATPAAEALPGPPAGDVVRFQEVWAYLLPGEEALWSAAAPITDLALFDFSLDSAGRLKGKVNRTAMERARGRGLRTHIVVAASSGPTLLHLALSPRYPARAELLRGLTELARTSGADGLQLDFEGARSEERGDFVSFVKDLRAALPRGTVLSLALPAKTRDAPGAIVYADLAPLADRFFIMIYDHHWRGGPPGTISGLEWHDEVLACVKGALPLPRVVVGLPFYGRVWQREEVARAVKHSRAMELAATSGATIRQDAAGGSTFTFRTEVTAECWFEDATSLRAKLASAAAKGFIHAGFWRLGQEDPAVWSVVGQAGQR